MCIMWLAKTTRYLNCPPTPVFYYLGKNFVPPESEVWLWFPTRLLLFNLKMHLGYLCNNGTMKNYKSNALYVVCCTVK